MEYFSIVNVYVTECTYTFAVGFSPGVRFILPPIVVFPFPMYYVYVSMYFYRIKVYGSMLFKSFQTTCPMLVTSIMSLKCIAYKLKTQAKLPTHNEDYIAIFTILFFFFSFKKTQTALASKHYYCLSFLKIENVIFLNSRLF